MHIGTFLTVTLLCFELCTLFGGCTEDKKPAASPSTAAPTTQKTSQKNNEFFPGQVITYQDAETSLYARTVPLRVLNTTHCCAEVEFPDGTTFLTENPAIVALTPGQFFRFKSNWGGRGDDPFGLYETAEDETGARLRTPAELGSSITILKPEQVNLKEFDRLRAAYEATCM